MEDETKPVGASLWTVEGAGTSLRARCSSERIVNARFSDAA